MTAYETPPLLSVRSDDNRDALGAGGPAAAFLELVQKMVEDSSRATLDDRANEGGSTLLESLSGHAHTLNDLFDLSYTPTLAPTTPAPTGDDYSMQKVYICLLFNMVRPRPLA